MKGHGPWQKPGAGRESGRTHPPSLSLSTPQSSTGACFGQTQPESRNPRAQAKRSYSTHRVGHRRAEMCVGDTRGNPEGREADRDPAEQSSSLQPFWHHRQASRKKIFSQTRGWGWFHDDSLYFNYYYISSTSDHQALDPGVGDPWVRGYSSHMALPHQDPEPQAWCTTARFTLLTSSQLSSTFSCPQWHSFGVSRGTACKGEAIGCPPCPRPPGKGDGEGGYLLTLSNPQPTEPCSQVGLALHSARSPVIKVITDLFLLLAHCPPTTQHFPPPPLTASSLPGLNPQTQCPHGRDCSQRPASRWTEAATRSESPLPGTPLSPQGKNQDSSRGSGRLPQTTGCKRCPEGTRAAFSRQLKGGQAKLC